MGYALVPLVRPSPFPNGRPRGRRPFGYDQSAHNFVVLDPGDKSQPSSGVALAWFESDIADARVEKVADGKGEPLAVSARAKLGAKLGGRAFRGDPFNAQILTLLKERGLRPKVNGDLSIWLGPGDRGQNQFAFEKHPATKHSKAWADTFNRANGAVGGSTGSGGGFTWSDQGTTAFNIVSNQAVLSHTGTGTDGCLIVDTDTDTDDAYTQVDMVMTIPGASYEFGAQLFVGGESTPTDSGHRFECFVSDLFSPIRAIKALLADVELDSDATSTSSGTIYIGIDGSDVTAKVDGVVILGPSTSVTEPTGAGNRRCRMVTELAGASGTYVWTLDNFLGGDIVTAIGPLVGGKLIGRGVLGGRLVA